MRKSSREAVRILALCLSSLCVASVAAAERGTVHLTNGGQVSGELVEYVPGNHVTIDLGGQKVSFPAAEIASVDLAAAQPSAPPPPPPMGGPVVESVPAAPPAMDPHVQELLLRRHELLRRRIGFGLPIALMSAGLGLTIVGWGVIYPTANDVCGSFDETRDCRWTAGKKAGAVLGSLGIGATIAGIALLPMRIAKRRNRAREIEAIDGELRGMGFTAKVEPWIRGGQNSVYGLRATLTF